MSEDVIPRCDFCNSEIKGSAIYDGASNRIYDSQECSVMKEGCDRTDIQATVTREMAISLYKSCALAQSKEVPART